MEEIKMTLNDVIARIKGGKCEITIVAPRKYRTQLEYNIHQPTMHLGPQLKRTRNGTLYKYSNGAVVKIRMSVGLGEPDYNLLDVKAKEITAWFKSEMEVVNPEQTIVDDQRDTR